MSVSTTGVVLRYPHGSATGYPGSMASVTHRTAEERSLALHREVARRLLERPELLDRARARVQTWCREGGPSGRWAARRQELLAASVAEVAAAITADSDEACALRQCSPPAAGSPRVHQQQQERLVREALYG
jgi:hypothetical protein